MLHILDFVTSYANYCISQALAPRGQLGRTKSERSARQTRTTALSALTMVFVTTKPEPATVLMDFLELLASEVSSDVGLTEPNAVLRWVLCAAAVCYDALLLPCRPLSKQLFWSRKLPEYERYCQHLWNFSYQHSCFKWRAGVWELGEQCPVQLRM